MAAKRNKSLHGWSYMTGGAIGEFDLSAVPNDDNVVFGQCRHMDICGWPDSDSERLMVAQALSQLECRRCLLPEPQVPVAA